MITRIGLIVTIILLVFTVQDSYAKVNNPPPVLSTPSPVADGDIDLVWSAGNFGGGTSFLTYFVERSTTGSFSGEETTVSSNQLGLTFTDSTPSDSLFYYRVVPKADDKANPDFKKSSNIESVTSDSSDPIVTGSTTNIVDGGNTDKTGSDEYTELCTATDNNPASPVCSVQSGSIDTTVLGLQTVIYEATDDAGNKGTDTISTTVVNPTVPPTNPPQQSSSGGGGSADKHKTAPTSSLDWNTGNQLVKDGFTVNGKSINITDTWHTDFDKQLIQTESTNIFKIKTFAQNNGLMVQELAFGITEVGDYNSAEVLIEVWYDYDKSIKDVIVKQDTKIINDSFLVFTDQVSCNGGTAMCYVTTFVLVFNERMEYDVMAIKAFDMDRRTMMPTYFNDGIEITGESMNPYPMKWIRGSEKYEGLIEVVQIKKYSNLWMAGNGRIFEEYGHESFRLINPEITNVRDYGHVDSRTHSAWNQVIDWQKELAIQYFDSSLIQKQDEGFTSYPEDEIEKRKETLSKLRWYNAD